MFLEQLYGHLKIERSLNNLLQKKRLPSALFFSGPPFVGKLAFALRLAQGFYCSLLKEPRLGGCGSCDSCGRVALFMHPQVALLSISSRFSLLRLYQSCLLKNKGAAGKAARLGVRREARHLLYRSNKQFLVPARNLKGSAASGVKLKPQALEELLAQLYLAIEAFERDDNLLLEERHLAGLQKLENSLDRSFIPKSGLTKLFTWCQREEGLEKIVVVENVELLHPSLVGSFLKVLEDPFPKVRFLLLCENEQRINRPVIQPLLSRCLQFRFSSLPSLVVHRLAVERFGLSQAEAREFDSLEALFSQVSFKASAKPVNSTVLTQEALEKLVFSKTFPAVFLNSSFKKALQEDPQLLRQLLSHLRLFLQQTLQAFYLKAPPPKLLGRPSVLKYHQALATLKMVEENQRLYENKQLLPISFLLEIWLALSEAN